MIFFFQSILFFNDKGKRRNGEKSPRGETSGGGNKESRGDLPEDETRRGWNGREKQSPDWKYVECTM